MLPPPSDSAWITPYGVILGLGLLMAWWYARRRAVASGTDPSHIDLMVPLIFLISILGAWLLPILSPGDTLLMDNTGKSQIRFRLFGLLFVATPAIFVYCRIAGLGCRRILDLFALPAVLWLVCLRIGCFLAGDGCYGKPGDFPWCVIFPEAVVTHFSYQGVIHYVTPNSVTDVLTPVHPTPIYETIISCFSFGLLWQFRRKLEYRSGVLFGLTLLAMGIERFTVEFWRINQKYVWLFSGAQVISLILIGIGILMVIYRWQKAQLQA